VLGNSTLQTNYTYYPWTTPNGLGRLQRIQTSGSLQDMNYAYDAVGNVQSINGSDYVSFTYKKTCDRNGCRRSPKHF
jgi:hypothetical protein